MRAKLALPRFAIYGLARAERGRFLEKHMSRAAGQNGLPSDQSVPAVATKSGFGTRFGLMPMQSIEAMIAREMISATNPVDNGQIQPASLDLRLGSRAYRVRASFLPGKNKRVADHLGDYQYDEMNLDEGAILEQGRVYLIELQERLKLPKSISAAANPKSSTGRLDIFTRLISDHSEAFDTVAAGYEGPLFAEISPRSFSIRVRKGSKLNQLRFRRLNARQKEGALYQVSDAQLARMHATAKLVDGTLMIKQGLVLRVGLSAEGSGDGIVGYRAQRHTDSVDVDRVGAYDRADFWEPMTARNGRIILDPHQFYILASAERLRIPPNVAAEMVPIDPAMGEFRVHYAGFFDPGFGHIGNTGEPGSRAVLEVRSHEVPFVLEHNQIIGRLVFETMAEEPSALYGQTQTSNYQGQGLKLSKHFT